MAYAPVYHSGEFPIFFFIEKYFSECFIYCFYTFFLTKGECKLSINQQQRIYDNGKALPEIYRERVLDLHHHGFRKDKFRRICELALAM